MQHRHPYGQIHPSAHMHKYGPVANLCLNANQTNQTLISFNQSESRIKGLRVIFLICDQTQILCNGAIDTQETCPNTCKNTHILYTQTHIHVHTQTHTHTHTLVSDENWGGL